MYVEQNVDSTEYDGRFQNIQDYILYSLGYPQVRIEITKKHVMLAVIEAITKYYQKAALDLELRVVPVSDSFVTIPSDINRAVIRDVIFPQQDLDAYSRGFGTQIADDFGVYTMNSASAQLLIDFDMSRYYMYLSRLEDFRNITGTKPGYTFINGGIQITPADLSVNEVGILFKAMPSDNNLDQQYWIKEYAMARTMHMLGMVRSKFSGFQASNSNIAADGEALKTEAKETMAKLLTDLDQMREPLPILKG